MEYLNSKQIAEIMGCSKEAARDMMAKMPCFRPHGRRQGCPMYVKKEDFWAYVDVNTIRPGMVLSRPTTWETDKQKQERELKEWHRKRRENLQSMAGRTCN